jgi:hypothetical protein
MDAAREGHADIASMLREAGASDAVSAAEAAPLHKVTNYITARWFQPSPRRTPLLPYIPTHTHTRTHTRVAGCGGCQGCWGRLRQRGLDEPAAQQAQSMNTLPYLTFQTKPQPCRKQLPREREFTFYVICFTKILHSICFEILIIIRTTFISVNRSGPAPTR